MRQFNALRYLIAFCRVLLRRSYQNLLLQRLAIRLVLLQSMAWNLLSFRAEFWLNFRLHYLCIQSAHNQLPNPVTLR